MIMETRMLSVKCWVVPLLTVYDDGNSYDCLPKCPVHCIGLILDISVRE